MTETMLHRLLLLLSLALLTACSTTQEDDPTVGMSVDEIYEEAHAKMENGEYESAIELYERLESRYPYGPYAEQAQLDIAYSYYKYQEPESAILAAERFIKLHPEHANVDYAYYLRALARHDTDQSFMARWFDQDPTERDPKSMRQAFQYFSELVERFPKSRYTPESIQRMYDLRNSLAKYEVHVARYYTRRNAFVAAANRAKYVVENYQGTPFVPEALAIMINAYQQLDLQELAKDAQRVLELNYPDYKIKG